MKLPKYQREEGGSSVDVIIKAKTDNQQKLIDSIRNNQVTFAVGPAGSGKTFLATSLGLKGLLNKTYKRLIITRPLVQAGEETGFLPGGIQRKLDPYMIPIYEELEKHMPMSTVRSMINNTMGQRIEIVPFAYMQGRNFHDCFIVADEFQNAKEDQILMLLTRLGETSKAVFSGDFTQSQLFRREAIGVGRIQYLAKNVDNVDMVELNTDDIVRSKLVADIAVNWRKYDEIKKERSF